MKLPIVALLLTLSAAAWGQSCTAGYSDCVLKPDTFALMPASLQAVKEDFATRLSVVFPIVETADGYYFGSGCAAHECGKNEAAWVINKATGKGAAIIMRYRPGHETFELYGTSIPAPLADWAVHEGMTEGNRLVVPEPIALPSQSGVKEEPAGCLEQQSNPCKLTYPNGNLLETLGDGTTWIEIHEQRVRIEVKKGWPFTSGVESNIWFLLPPSDVIGAPQAEMIHIEGECQSRTYRIDATTLCASKVGRCDGEILDGDYLSRRVEPGTTMALAFGLLCK
jgi:hypothetical protein